MRFIHFFGRLDTWVQIWCFGLAAVFVASAAWMLWEAESVGRAIKRAADLFARLKPSRGEERRFGRPLEAIEKVRQGVGKLGPASAEWWRQVEDVVEKYESPDGKEGYFVTRPVDELVSVDDLTRGYSWSVYHAM